MTSVEVPATGAPEAGRARVGRRSRGGGPQPYDFRRPSKLSREHVRQLQMAYETFARHWTTLLTSTLRVVAQVGLVAVEQVTYDEYISGLANPTCLNLLTIDPLPGVAVLEFSLSTGMAAVDHLLGGPGGEEQPQRPPTDIEAALLRGIVERTTHELRYAFEPIVRFEPKVASLETNPQFSQAASAADMVIVASFDLRLGSVESLATLCLPYAAITPALDAASMRQVTSDRERTEREHAHQALENRLHAVPVDVSVRFEPTQLTPADILGLRVGDVLPLRHPTTRPLRVVTAEVTFAHAVPGTHGRRLACLVVAPPEDS